MEKTKTKTPKEDGQGGTLKDEDGNDVYKNYLETIFTIEELKALDSDISLKEATKPTTDEELIEKFKTQLFFNIGATDSHGNFLFPEQTLLAEEFKKFGLELGVTPKALPPKETPKSTEEETNKSELPKEEFSFGGEGDNKVNNEGDDVPF